MAKANVDLEHSIRKMVFNHIVEYPGVSFTTLKKIYDLSESTLRYHLKYLEQNQRIVSNIEAGKLHYYPCQSKLIASSPSVRNPRAQELTNHQERILNAIIQFPGINQTELIARTSLKRHILTYNLSRLIEMGKVRKYNHVQNVCYEYISNEQLQNEILKVLTVKLLNNEIDEETYLKLKNRLK